MVAATMREHFLLQPDLVFLNHGSFGACPRPVFENYQGWQLKLEQQPVAFLDQSRELFKHKESPRAALADRLGASAQDIVGVSNVTEGLNIIAQSLQLQPGDEILTSNHEYNALENTWQFVANRSGANLVAAEIPLPLNSEETFTQTLVNAMTDKTKVLFLSHVTSPTALVFPIENIVTEARNRGITTVIDGAHAPGLIDVNLTKLNADFYSGNCHKWMMAPKGAGFLWARQDLQATLEPLVVSHGWVPRSGDPAQPGAFGRSRFLDNFEMVGTRDPAAWMALPAAIEFQQRHGWPQCAQDCAALAEKTALAIAARTKIPLLASTDYLARQMISIPLPTCDVASVKRQLLERFNIEIPVFEWSNRCFVRLSVNVYNTESEMAILIDGLSELFGLDM